MKLILHIRGAVFVNVFVAAASQVHAQLVVTNAPPMNYQQVGPGVTLRQLSPVVYFRGILGMTPAERDRALAGKSAGYKKAVLEKVQEYQALPPDIREVRLHQTQLRWDLITLMKSPPAARPPVLKDIPAADRALLESRLREWDLTPKPAQDAFLNNAVLTNASFLDSYLRWLSASAAEQKDMLDKWPDARRREWTNQIARWQALPEDRRQQLSDQFRQFFDLDPAQQQTTLTTFSDEERKDMETALRNFARLPAAQRKACVDSFQKFANLAPEERDQFLGNAARWEAMNAGERNLWRTLVQTFPIMPPMPSGFNTLHSPPPLPGMRPPVPITYSPAANAAR
jgi:hypothetical protein